MRVHKPRQWALKLIHMTLQEWLDSLLFGIVIVTDFILVTSLVTILYGKRTIFARTKSVLDRLALYAVVASTSTPYVHA